MNLAMHGDGSSNIFHANSLLSPGEWSNTARVKLGLGDFDVVFTNPPFGSKLPVDDAHILAHFRLSSFETARQRGNLPPEQLFVERCLDFLKPGGRMAIVLPDSILTNPGLSWLRRWVLRNAWVIASVDLPRETFAKSDTHTMTAVLILQKFTEEERRLVEEMGRTSDYDIFMAIADKVGWSLRGDPVYLRTPEGEEIAKKVTRRTTVRNATGDLIEVQREENESIVEDHLPLIADLFVDWLRQSPPQRWSR